MKRDLGPLQQDFVASMKVHGNWRWGAGRWYYKSFSEDVRIIRSVARRGILEIVAHNTAGRPIEARLVEPQK